MSAVEKVAFGTQAWLEVVGRELCAAVTRARLPAELDVSLLERYGASEPTAQGLLRGFRLDIRGGQPSFRAGVGINEVADVMVDAPIQTVGTLARMRSTDPAYGETIGRFLADGSLKVTGDPSRLGDWMNGAHDIVCDRTI